MEIWEAGELRGYGLGRRGRIADHLGPWMARDEGTATRLLEAFLSRSTRPRVFVDVFADHPFAPRLLAARGFQLQRPLVRMSRGQSPVVDDRDVLAVLGPEFG